MAKKYLRNLLCSLVVVAGIFLISTVSVKAAAPKVIASGSAGANIDWTLYSDGNLEFVGVGNMPDYLDPESGETNGEQAWYRYRRNTNTITISDGITSIGAGAFMDFAETKVVWPKSGLKTIGKAAFKNNTALTEAVIPSSVNRIDEAAFKNCGSLKVIDIKGSVATIEKETFTGMTDALINVTYGCSTVKSRAFFGSAQRIEFPSSVTSIASDVLDKDNPWKLIRGGSQAVERVAYNNFIPYIDNNKQYSVDSKYITLVSSSYDFTGQQIVPEVRVKYTDGNETATLIEDKDYILVFNNDSSKSLGKHTVEVRGIGSFSFSKDLTYSIVANMKDCKIKLGYTSTPADGTAKKPSVKVTINGMTLKEGTHYSLSYTNNVKAGTASAVVTGKSKAFCQGTAKASFLIFEKTRFYYDDCIYIITSQSEDKMEVMLADADPVSSLFRIPNTVEYDGEEYKVVEIGQYAFKNVKKVTQVNLGKNIRKIKDGAFYGCVNLTKVKLNDKLESIGNRAFVNCLKLKSINIPAKVKTIGKSAFLGCKLLSKVKIQSELLNADRIGASAFRNIHRKAVVSVPASKVSAYKKILKKRGLTESTQKVIAIK